MNSIIIVGLLGTAFALWLLLVIVAWIDRRSFMRLNEGPHKSTMRLAEQLDIAWRRNRRREREL